MSYSPAPSSKCYFDLGAHDHAMLMRMACAPASRGGGDHRGHAIDGFPLPRISPGSPHFPQPCVA